MISPKPTDPLEGKNTLLSKVLIVGTTEDYVEWIRQASPDRAVFLVDREDRQRRCLSCPSSPDEVITDLDQMDAVRKELTLYLQAGKVTIDGIVCFDCEYMALAAGLADIFHLPYPSLAAIEHCRNKYLSKIIWEKHGVNCPGVRLIRSLKDAFLFFNEMNLPCVLKPVSGSGSELVFICRNAGDIRHAYERIESGLEKRADLAMYRNEKSSSIVMETFADGSEYSCDFVIEDKHVAILRLTRKMYYPFGPFGTTWAYILTSRSAIQTGEKDLEELLADAAGSLGIDRSICMVDFIIQGDDVVFLEMTPRPGGDCLPHLLKTVRGFDMLQFAMDFSSGKPVVLPSSIHHEEPMMGVRIFAGANGILKTIHTENVRKDKRILDVYLKYPSGHQVTMPPEDYDSWILGHVVYKPEPARNLELQLEELKQKIIVEIE
ncbi:MAG: ATP-grasp domain-containing protein [Proteobacteria bacterium]|nr:ATP-grasp domain-containing protein [Pseudomonadota bacterium]